MEGAGSTSTDPQRAGGARARTPLFRFDPGWPFVVAGLGLLVAGVLIPAQRELHELENTRAVHAAIEDRSVRQLAAYDRFLNDLEQSDEQLVRRLAASQLNQMPEGERSLLLVPSMNETVTAWIERSEPLEMPETAEYPDTLLTRLATGPRRLWVLACGAFLVFIGLLLGPSSFASPRRVRAARADGGATAVAELPVRETAAVVAASAAVIERAVSSGACAADGCDDSSDEHVAASPTACDASVATEASESVAALVAVEHGAVVNAGVENAGVESAPVEAITVAIDGTACEAQDDGSAAEEAQAAACAPVVADSVSFEHREESCDSVVGAAVTMSALEAPSAAEVAPPSDAACMAVFAEPAIEAEDAAREAAAQVGPECGEEVGAEVGAEVEAETDSETVSETVSETGDLLDEGDELWDGGSTVDDIECDAETDAETDDSIELEGMAVDGIAEKGESELSDEECEDAAEACGEERLEDCATDCDLDTDRASDAGSAGEFLFEPSDEYLRTDGGEDIASANTSLVRRNRRKPSSQNSACEDAYASMTLFDGIDEDRWVDTRDPRSSASSEESGAR